MVIAIGNDKMFYRFCEIIGDEKIAQNKLFINNNLRNKNLDLLRKQIEVILKKKKKEFWIKKFQKIRYLVHILILLKIFLIVNKLKIEK